jgi:hypothetical protein
MIKAEGGVTFATSGTITSTRNHGLVINDVVRFERGSATVTTPVGTGSHGFELDLDYCVKTKPSDTTITITKKYPFQACDADQDAIVISTAITQPILRMRKIAKTKKFTLSTSASKPVYMAAALDASNAYDLHDATYTQIVSDQVVGAASPTWDAATMFINTGKTKILKLSGEIITNLDSLDNRGLFYYDDTNKKALFTVFADINPITTSGVHAVRWICGTFRPRPTVVPQQLQVRIVNQTVYKSDGTVTLGSPVFSKKGNLDVGCFNLNTRNEADFVCSGTSRRDTSAVALVAPKSRRGLLSAYATTQAAAVGRLGVHIVDNPICDACLKDFRKIDDLDSQAKTYMTGQSGVSAEEDATCLNHIMAKEHMNLQCGSTLKVFNNGEKYRVNHELCYKVYCCLVGSRQVGDSVASICAEPDKVVFDSPYGGKDESLIPLTVGYTQVCGSSTLEDRSVAGSQKSFVCVDYDFWDTFDSGSSIFVWAIFSLISYILIGVHLVLDIILKVMPSSKLTFVNIKYVPFLIMLVTALTIGMTFWVAFEHTDGDTVHDDGMKRSEDEDAYDFQQVKGFFEAGVKDYSKDGLSVLASFAVAAYVVEFIAAWMTYKHLDGAPPTANANTEIGFSAEGIKLDIESGVASNEPEAPPKVKIVSAFADRRSINGMKF